MALTTQAMNLVKQRSQHAMRNAGGFAALALKGFWKGLNQDAKRMDMYFLPIGDLTADEVGVDAACKVHAIYLKKGTTATDAWYKIFDDATHDDTAALAVIAIPLLTASEEVFVAFPGGMVLASGLCHGSYTAFLGYNGSTASTSGDGPASGFVLVSDP
jgi:hypothetical protein